MRTKNSMRIKTRAWVWQWGCRGRKSGLQTKTDGCRTSVFVYQVVHRSGDRINSVSSLCKIAQAAVSIFV